MKASPRSWSLQAEFTSPEAWKKAKYPKGHNQGMLRAYCSAKVKPNQTKHVSEVNMSTTFTARRLIHFGQLCEYALNLR